MFQPVFGIVERATEGPRLVQVNQWDRHFHDLHPMSHGLHPHLQRHRITLVGDLESPQGGRSISLETAKRIRQIQPQAFVEPARDLDIDPPALFGRLLAGIEDTQVTAARDDIGLCQMRGDLGNPLRLVLPIAIKSHEAVVAAVDRRLKSRTQARPIAQVARMTNRLHRRKLSRSTGVRSVEPSSTTNTSPACLSTSVSTPTRLASSLWTGMAVRRRIGKVIAAKELTEKSLRPDGKV